MATADVPPVGKTTSPLIHADPLDYEIMADDPVSARHLPEIDPSHLHKVTLDCRGRSREDMLRAVAATAPLVHARKSAPGQIEVTVELPPDVYEATGGARGLELQTLNMLGCLDEVAALEPGALKGPISGAPREGLLEVRIARPETNVLPGVKATSQTGRHVVTTHSFNRTKLERIARRFGPGARIREKRTPDGCTVYVMETVTTRDSYVHGYHRMQGQLYELGAHVVAQFAAATMPDGKMPELPASAEKTNDPYPYRRPGFVQMYIPGGTVSSGQVERVGNVPVRERSYQAANKLAKQMLEAPLSIPKSEIRLVKGVEDGIDLCISSQAIMQLGERRLKSYHALHNPHANLSGSSIHTLLFPTPDQIAEARYAEKVAQRRSESAGIAIAG